LEAGSYGRTPTHTTGQRLATETKQAFKTTEFWVYVGMLLALLIAGLVADSGDEATGTADGFGAEKVWLYATLLTIGYLVSRGLAKAGSRDPYWDRPDAGGSEGGLGERVKAAAQVIKEGPDSSSTTTTHRTEQDPRTY
jgi:hypothetical protein